MSDKASFDTFKNSLDEKTALITYLREYRKACSYMVAVNKDQFISSTGSLTTDGRFYVAKAWSQINHPVVTFFLENDLYEFLCDLPNEEKPTIVKNNKLEEGDLSNHLLLGGYVFTAKMRIFDSDLPVFEYNGTHVILCEYNKSSIASKNIYVNSESLHAKHIDQIKEAVEIWFKAGLAEDHFYYEHFVENYPFCKEKGIIGRLIGIIKFVPTVEGVNAWILSFHNQEKRPINIFGIAADTAYGTPCPTPNQCHECYFQNVKVQDFPCIDKCFLKKCSDAFASYNFKQGPDTEPLKNINKLFMKFGIELDTAFTDKLNAIKDSIKNKDNPSRPLKLQLGGLGGYVFCKDYLLSIVISKITSKPVFTMFRKNSFLNTIYCVNTKPTATTDVILSTINKALHVLEKYKITESHPYYEDFVENYPVYENKKGIVTIINKMLDCPNDIEYLNKVTRFIANDSQPYVYSKEEIDKEIFRLKKECYEYLKSIREITNSQQREAAALLFYIRKSSVLNTNKLEQIAADRICRQLAIW